MLINAGLDLRHFVHNYGNYKSKLEEHPERCLSAAMGDSHWKLKL